MAILMITLQITTMAMMMKTLMTMVSSVDENRFIIIGLLPQSNVDEQAKAEKKQGSSRLRVILVAVMAIILMLLSI